MHCAYKDRDQVKFMPCLKLNFDLCKTMIANKSFLVTSNPAHYVMFISYVQHLFSVVYYNILLLSNGNLFLLYMTCVVSMCTWFNASMIGSDYCSTIVLL